MDAMLFRTGGIIMNLVAQGLSNLSRFKEHGVL